MSNKDQAQAVEDQPVAEDVQVESTDPDIQAADQSSESGLTGTVSKGEMSKLARGESLGPAAPAAPADGDEEDEIPVESHNPNHLKKRIDATGQVAGKWQVSSEEKIVEVFMRMSVRCKIGPRWWDLKAGQRYRVPASVKDVLRNRGALGVT